ncbi:MAG: type II secretion system protein GspN [Deltaproteobacteria bacterium]|nr:MAG: type II secretion system protein GspN [Deltaproteobacteria bacterium]
MAIKDNFKEWAEELVQKVLTLREKRSRWWTIIGYSLIGILLFLFFTYLSFPYPQLKEKLIRYLEDQTNLRVEVEDFRPSLFTGLIFNGVDISPEATSEGSALLSLQSLRLRISVFPLIWGTLSLKLSSDLYGGRFNGKLKKRGSLISLSCKWEDLEIEEYLPIRENYGFDIKGKFAGKMDLSVDPKNMTDNDGNISFQIDGAELEESSMFGLFKLPGVNFDQCQGKLVLDSEKLLVEQGSFVGKDLEIEINGNLLLQEELRKSNIDLMVRLKLAGDLSGELKEVLPLLRAKSDSKGFYNFSIKGNLAKPRLGS